MAYNIEWREYGVAGGETLVAGVEELYYDLEGLAPDTDYEFRVQEEVGGEASPWSGWHPFTTASGVVSVEAVLHGSGELEGSTFNPVDMVPLYFEDFSGLPDGTMPEPWQAPLAGGVLPVVDGGVVTGTDILNRSGVVTLGGAQAHQVTVRDSLGEEASTRGVVLEGENRTYNIIALLAPGDQVNLTGSSSRPYGTLFSETFLAGNHDLPAGAFTELEVTTDASMFRVVFRGETGEITYLHNLPTEWTPQEPLTHAGVSVNDLSAIESFEVLGLEAQAPGVVDVGAGLSATGSVVGRVGKGVVLSAGLLFASALAAAPAVDKGVGAELQAQGQVTALASSSSVVDTEAVLVGAATLTSHPTAVRASGAELFGQGEVSAGVAGQVSARVGLTATGVLQGVASIAGAQEAALAATGVFEGQPHVLAASGSGLTATGVLEAQPAGAQSVPARAQMDGAGRLQSRPSKIINLSVTASGEGSLVGQPNVRTDAQAQPMEGAGEVQARPSVVTDVKVTATGEGALSATAVVETAQTASGALVGEGQVAAGAVRDAAGVGAVTGVFSLEVVPAVDRGIRAALKGEAGVEALPGRTRVGACEFLASGAVTAQGQAAAAQDADGAMQGHGVLTAEAAKVVEVSLSLTAEAMLVAQGAVDQRGGARMFCRGVLTADTLGGTPVYRGYLYAKEVAIKPSMSCYTKLEPTFTGGSGVSPSVTGTVIVKPR